MQKITAMPIATAIIEFFVSIGSCMAYLLTLINDSAQGRIRWYSVALRRLAESAGMQRRIGNMGQK